MPTPAQLRKMADEADRDADDWDARARVSRGLAVQLRETADEMERAGTNGLLHSRSQRARVNDVDDTAKLNMSRASSDDPFAKACRAKGFTQNGLAAKLDIPASLLSMYRRGVRRIPQARAEQIERLTGWKATAKNWPGGIVSAD